MPHVKETHYKLGPNIDLPGHHSPFFLHVCLVPRLSLSADTPMRTRPLFCRLLILTSTFAGRQSPLIAQATTPTNFPHRSLVALSGEKGFKKNELNAVSMVERATAFHISIVITNPSERLLVTPISDSVSLQIAIGAWCQNSANATATYGDISIWCVEVMLYRYGAIECSILPLNS